MNRADERTPERPWYRQFWPWFVAALPTTAVIASLLTVWIAIEARPNRIDGYGSMTVPVEFSRDRQTLRFDLGLADAAAWRPDSIDVTMISRRDGSTRQLAAARLDERWYQTAVESIEPGRYDLWLTSDAQPGGLRGSWSYPAPVWKLVVDE